MDSVANSSSPRDKAIAYLTWIAFFFLLQTGEYCAGGIDVVSTPFNLRDIQFSVRNQPTQDTTASATTFVILLFTTQKMASKGNSSDTAEQDTPVHVQWRPSGVVWHIYNNTAPPQTRI